MNRTTAKMRFYCFTVFRRIRENVKMEDPAMGPPFAPWLNYFLSRQPVIGPFEVLLGCSHRIAWGASPLFAIAAIHTIYDGLEYVEDRCLSRVKSAGTASELVCAHYARLKIENKKSSRRVSIPWEAFRSGLRSASSGKWRKFHEKDPAISVTILQIFPKISVLYIENFHYHLYTVYHSFWRMIISPTFKYFIVSSNI